MKGGVRDKVYEILIFLIQEKTERIEQVKYTGLKEVILNLLRSRIWILCKSKREDIPKKWQFLRVPSKATDTSCPYMKVS